MTKDDFFRFISDKPQYEYTKYLLSNICYDIQIFPIFEKSKLTDKLQIEKYNILNLIEIQISKNNIDILQYINKINIENNIKFNHNNKNEIDNIIKKINTLLLNIL